MKHISIMISVVFHHIIVNENVLSVSLNRTFPSFCAYILQENHSVKLEFVFSVRNFIILCVKHQNKEERKCFI